VQALSSKNWLPTYELDERDEIIHEKEEEIKKLTHDIELNRSQLSKLHDNTFVDKESTPVGVKLSYMLHDNNDSNVAKENRIVNLR